jgi:crossover junction endodeoxyribonuclease RuvC
VRDGNVASCAPGSQPRICGLDLSLTSTGIARIGEEAELWRITPKRATGCDRLNQILREITSRTDGAGLVVIEGPSYGSTGGKEHERGGLWWLVRYHLWQASQNVAVVPPAVLKKYATGYGNAGKDTVLAAVIRRYPDVMVDGNDVADALVLAAMGADHLGYPLAVVPQIQRAALTKVDWPPFADLRSPP